jgi:radical SAM protein with 4Fe4S-binding SPASM domain
MKTLIEMNNLRRKYGSGLFKGITTFSLNSIAYILRKQPIRGPLFAGFDITYRCQAKCEYCDRWKIGLEKKKEISTEKALQTVRELGNMGTWILSIGGGEPLLRKDICKIIKEAKKYGLLVNLNTNGLLLKKMADELIDSGVDSITISMEGYTAKQHDSIRRFNGLFEAVKDGIKYIKESRKGNTPSIKLRFDVNKKNYLLLEKYIQFWSPKVDEIVLQPIHEDLAGSFVITPEMRFDEEDKKRFRLLFNKLRKKYKWLNNAYYNEFESFFFERNKLAKKYKCYSGYFTISINPDMEVFPCAAFVHKLGSLEENTITEIWKSKKITEFRKLIRERKNRCFCWYNCNGTLNCYLQKTIGRFDKK